MMILTYQEAAGKDRKEPRIGRDVYLAPTAVVIGDVELGDGASVWFGAVLRGDEGQIVIGAGTNIQDNAVLHTTPTHPTILGRNVTVGHGALLEGCTIGDGAVIGMGAIVLHGAEVAEQAMVAAGSVVTPGTLVPPRTLVAGAPAEPKKPLSGAALLSVERSAGVYHELAARYRQSADEPLSSP
jgi:carbonic anhydrase/acetyltransferase-like protein (isoleucine patch superfamily)